MAPFFTADFDAERLTESLLAASAPRTLESFICSCFDYDLESSGRALLSLTRWLSLLAGATFSMERHQRVGSFRKLGVPYLGVPIFGGPHNKDPAKWGTILGSPIFGKPRLEAFGLGVPSFKSPGIGLGVFRV